MRHGRFWSTMCVTFCNTLSKEGNKGRFYRCDLAQASEMALSLTWLRREKGLHEVPCCGWPHNTATHTNNVHVVVLDSLFR
jgi:hypothetical protein